MIATVDTFVKRWLARQDTGMRQSDLGQIIRARRESLGMSQEELAHVPPAPNPLAFAALQRLLIDIRQQLQRATANDLRNLLLQLGARVEVHDGDVRVLFPPSIAAFIRGR